MTTLPYHLYADEAICYLARACGDPLAAEERRRRIADGRINPFHGPAKLLRHHLAHPTRKALA